MEEINLVSSGSKAGKFVLAINDNAGKNDIFFSLLDKVTAPIVYVGKDYGYKYVNKAWVDWFGGEISRITGNLVEDFIGQDAFVLMKSCFDEALNGKEVRQKKEIPFPHGRFFIEATYSPDLDETGNIQGCIVIIDNVSDKKKGETIAEYKQRELQDFPEDAIMGQHWVDKNGIIIWANKAELKMFGYTKAEYLMIALMKNRRYLNGSKKEKELILLKRNELLKMESLLMYL